MQRGEEPPDSGHTEDEPVLRRGASAWSLCPEPADRQKGEDRSQQKQRRHDTEKRLPGAGACVLCERPDRGSEGRPRVRLQVESRDEAGDADRGRQRPMPHGFAISLDRPIRLVEAESENARHARVGRAEPSKPAGSRRDTGHGALPRAGDLQCVPGRHVPCRCEKDGIGSRARRAVRSCRTARERRFAGRGGALREGERTTSGSEIRPEDGQGAT